MKCLFKFYFKNAKHENSYTTYTTYTTCTTVNMILIDCQLIMFLPSVVFGLYPGCIKVEVIQPSIILTM